MSQKLLLVHPARSVRMLLVRQLLAEVSSVSVEEARSSTEAFALLDKGHFNLVLTAPGPAGQDALLLHQWSQGRPGAPGILVVQTADEAHDLAHLLGEHGVVHMLRVPCAGADLIAAVERANNPRKLRVYARMHIPGATVSFLLDAQPVAGAVVNISAGGLLAEVTVPEGEHRPWTRLLEPTVLTLNLPGHPPLADLPAALLRLQMVVGEHGGATLKLAFRLAPVAETQARLEALLAEEQRRIEQAWFNRFSIELPTR